MTEHQQTLMKWAKRREKINAMHEKGMSYSKIAAETGLTSARIGQICTAVRLQRNKNGNGSNTT